MAAAGTHYPWYKKEDTDAFFALFQNNIANFVIIARSEERRVGKECER